MAFRPSQRNVIRLTVLTLTVRMASAELCNTPTRTACVTQGGGGEGKRVVWSVDTWGPCGLWTNVQSRQMVQNHMCHQRPPFSSSSWCYCLHIAGLLVLLFLPVKKTQRGRDPHEHTRLSRSKKCDENSLGQNSFPTTNNVCNQGPAPAARHAWGKE